MASPAQVIFSLQSKLIAAFVLVTLAALVLAGATFVALRRGEQEQQALDHVIAASPSIYAEFTFLQRRGDPAEVLGEFVHVAAREQDVRVLLVDRYDGTIAADTNGDLGGDRLVLPEEFQIARVGPTRLESYVSWRPEGGTPGDDLILVSALPDRLRSFRSIPLRAVEQYWIVLAVPENTVTRAWVHLLPTLGIAAAIALPVAVLLAVLIAQYITGPLHRLTDAAQRLAEGDFDVAVSVDRRDEVGRLARTFSTMARRVGEAQAQMRALLANVSHDLKTPLTSILGFGQALRDGSAQSEAEVRHMGEVIHDEAARLTARLNDLLYLSELESGQTVLQLDEVDLGRLVRGVVERIEPEARARDVHLATELAEGLTVRADGAKLERALENLLDNARKYTPSGRGILVSTDADRGRACIVVTNPAPDLSEEEVPRLFERFYRRARGRGPRPPEAGGSGLGLPIARDLIELHGGTLEGALRDGQVVFTARLPAGEPEDAKPQRGSGVAPTVQG